MPVVNDDSTEQVMTYLTNFFNGRSDLNSTLEAIYITHPHKDHTLALKRVVNGFTVRRFYRKRSGVRFGNRKCKERSVATQRNITTRKILNSDVMASGNRQGFTDGEIDPLQCADCDPALDIRGALQQAASCCACYLAVIAFWSTTTASSSSRVLACFDW